MSGSLDISRIVGLLFDIDGTLAETDDLYVQIIARHLAPLARILPEFDPLRVARWLIMTAETPANQAYALADWLHLDEAAAAIRRLVARPRRSDRIAHRPPDLIDQVGHMIELASARYRLGIVTARGDALARHFLSAHNLDTFFDVVVGARTVRRVKPHPAPVRQAARALGLKPEQCLMIGDTTVDILSGARAGTQTVGVLCGFGERAELLGAGADLILDSTADLKHVLGL